MQDTLTTIRNSRGRFFGLTTKNEVLNAQFLRETPKFITVRDRNRNEIRRFAKTSLRAANLRGA